MLYELIPLLNHPERTNQLLRTHEEKPDFLKRHTKHVYVDASEAKDGDYVYPFFFEMGDLDTLALQGFSTKKQTEWDDDFHQEQNHICTANIESLQLPDCGAHELGLEEIISWTRQLKELWYEAVQDNWDEDNFLEESFSCAGVQRAIKEVEDLETLVVTRTKGKERDVGGFDVTDLGALQRLALPHAYLVDEKSENAKPLGERLPRSLEELEVFYDDPERTNLIKGAPQPDWLLGLLDPEEEVAPKRIRIVSLEGPGESPIEYDWQRKPPGSTWQPPTVLTSAFETANVSCSIYLHPNRRFKRLVDSREFTDNWEDKRVQWRKEN
jgi:hypothetical protein